MQDSILGLGTKISHAIGHGKKEKKKDGALLNVGERQMRERKLGTHGGF